MFQNKLVIYKLCPIFDVVTKFSLDGPITQHEPLVGQIREHITSRISPHYAPGASRGTARHLSFGGRSGRPLSYVPQLMQTLVDQVTKLCPTSVIVKHFLLIFNDTVRSFCKSVGHQTCLSVIFFFYLLTFERQELISMSIINKVFFGYRGKFSSIHEQFFFSGYNLFKVFKNLRYFCNVSFGI